MNRVQGMATPLPSMGLGKGKGRMAVEESVQGSWYLDTPQYRKICDFVYGKMALEFETTREIRARLPENWEHERKLGDILDTLIAERRIGMVRFHTNKYIKINIS